ncbi:MAG: patatin-like phospholipase family protein [Dokdonella sp.]|jgi:NTE family protein|uniref:patatin-like phospholipase family protein n=1 Tax=Dokdonella sp. TaxID=2291710 RepID=UPI0025C00D99|nr:patatin-like phospholipase family protein [Dokdonella sp.]MBK8122008.1 patatin-like phospholipase family protein [Dokdonella sp.]
MLVVKSSAQARQKRSASRIGLAVAGGGPVGGIFEIGAVRALDDALDGLDMHALDIYVGISSGAFVAASLANRLSTAELCRIFITGDSDQFQFRAEDFIRPAIYEYLQRLAGVPRMLATALADFARHPFDLSISDSLMRLGSVLPTGLFDNSAIERFLRKAYSSHGRSNDFRELASKLIIVAVELESGQTVRFGTSGHDAVPISRAIEASAALPGLYPPVQIDGKHYVDGALRHTVHASVALDSGADLVLAINPLVPINTVHAKSQGKASSPNVVDGGLPAVLSQMFRTLLESRMQTSIPRYERTYPDSDLMLLQPDADDTDMFFTNVFSFSHRKRLAEHAYQSTLRDLRMHRKTLKPLLARHGISLRDKVLDDPKRTLLGTLTDKPPRRSKVTSHLHRALDDLDRALSGEAPAKPRTSRKAPAARRAARAKAGV